MYSCPKTILSSFICRHHLSPMTFPLPLLSLDLGSHSTAFLHISLLFQSQAVSTGHFLTFNLNPLSSFLEHLLCALLSPTAPYPTPILPTCAWRSQRAPKSIILDQGSAMEAFPRYFCIAKSRLEPRQVPAHREIETGGLRIIDCTVCFSKCLYSR